MILSDFFPYFVQTLLLLSYFDAVAAIEEREDGVLDAIISSLGGWPVIDRQWSESDFDLATLLGRRRRSHGFTPLLLMLVSVDERNSAVHRILVGYAEWFLHNKHY